MWFGNFRDLFILKIFSYLTNSILIFFFLEIFFELLRCWNFLKGPLGSPTTDSTAPNLCPSENVEGPSVIKGLWPVYPPKDAAFCLFLSEFHFWRLGRLFSELLLFITIYIKLLLLNYWIEYRGFLKKYIPRLVNPKFSKPAIMEGDGYDLASGAGTRCVSFVVWFL